MTTYYHESVFGSVELDELTGLPVLPDGMFWRVKRPRWSVYVSIQVRSQGMLFSTLVVESYIRYEDLSASNILKSACYIVKRKNPGILGVSASNRPDLLGDYPPKRARTPSPQATCAPRRGVTQWDSTTERRTK